MNDLTIWITYHDDQQVAEYHLEEDNTFRLFKGNDLTVEGEHINHLNRFYAETTTMYWVWKNQIKSKIIGFCHYRRKFEELLNIEPGQCQVYAINRSHSVFTAYKAWHNYQDMYDIIEILNEKYGKGNKYSEYLLKGQTFIPYSCFVMYYQDFEKLCDFLFPVLFEWDKKNGLNMQAERYLEKKNKDFRLDESDYQCRAVAFLAERLVSSFLICEMNNLCLISQ